MTKKENAVLALLAERYFHHTTYQPTEPYLKEVAQILCDMELEEMWILTQGDEK